MGKLYTVIASHKSKHFVLVAKLESLRGPNLFINKLLINLKYIYIYIYQKNFKMIRKFSILFIKKSFKNFFNKVYNFSLKFEIFFSNKYKIN